MYDVYEDKEAVTLVMECINGGTLYEWLMKKHKTKGYPERDSKRIFKLIFEALEYIHSRGIVHRDIKLDNILMCKNSLTDALTPKFVDFGLATVLLANEKNAETVGSIAYLSPEII